MVMRGAQRSHCRRNWLAEWSPVITWRVRLQEWIQGTKLSDLAAIQAQGLNIISLVNTGIQCSLRQLLEAGFFHAGAWQRRTAAKLAYLASSASL